MPNAELFAKIRDVIKASPEGHEQSTFESETSCGTTRCVAGWAIYLETGVPVFMSDSSIVLSPEARALELRLGLVRGDFENDVDMVHAIARELLGLSEQQAHQLFYRFSNQGALELVERYAEGE